MLICSSRLFLVSDREFGFNYISSIANRFIDVDLVDSRDSFSEVET